jgi:hypothetical protein
MQICLEQNYPKNLVLALELIHKIDISAKDIEIYWDKKLTDADAKSTIVFLFDKGKRNLDITTERYFEKGFRVIAFKMPETFTPFELSLTVLSLWRKILDAIQKAESPFVITYRYKGTKLYKIK